MQGDIMVPSNNKTNCLITFENSNYLFVQTKQ